MLDHTDISMDGVIVSQWIKDLENNNSRIHKEGVIEKALMAYKLGSHDASVFLFNAYLAYNPYYVYNVKKVPTTEGLTGKPNPWSKFWGLCEALRTRSITGYAARDAILDMSKMFDSDEWNYLCRRVLIKDFKCGVSEKTLNKILGKTEWAIPVFGCQLAKDSKNFPKKMKGVKRLEYKFDGVRALAVVTPTSVSLLSREGHPFDNFSEIVDAIMDKCRSCCDAMDPDNKFGRKFVLDGEIVGENFQKLMRQTRRKKDVQTNGMIYHIFDIIPFDDFEAGFSKIPQSDRTEYLEKARDHIADVDCLQISEGINVNLNTTDGNVQMKEFYDNAVEMGLEGIMIKDVNAPYECKKGTHWMKLKPAITVDLEIVGFEEGTEEGKNQGRLGAFICEGVDDGRTIRVNVGGGISDDARDEYWKDRDNLLGRVVEIKADAVTQNQDGTYSLRFPRFVRFRGFEAHEKL